MQQLCPAKFSQRDRHVIMKAVIDAETSLYTCNVRHGDNTSAEHTLTEHGQSSEDNNHRFRESSTREDTISRGRATISPWSFDFHLCSAGTRLGVFGMSLMPGSIGTGNLGLRIAVAGYLMGQSGDMF
ncbi:hypothetical protein PAAG_11821 [Paracoccidioides lutzii Pb01]|uniref:Uncharacterized protein n=1 Tax=Paracoccidioides lutzii (strain ATCC MYA-826 / Pb01) TaxID=502779 RepID=A0A0A2V0X7_PARBA|nr:hypothetical protein PAAG_11821 [Paracoccidioides lutzii Pb01]KGQ01471.1 hypothetical protein PAAG_11821 [Paracoccidioides lutzii Pb01]